MRLATCLNDAPCAIDVDLFEEGVGDLAWGLGRGAGRVDNHVGLDLLKDGDEPVHVGDVAVKVLDAIGIRPSVVGAAEVDDRHSNRVVPEEQVDDMMAEKATAAHHDHLSHLGLLCR